MTAMSYLKHGLAVTPAHAHKDRAPRRRAFTWMAFPQRERGLDPDLLSLWSLCPQNPLAVQRQSNGINVRFIAGPKPASELSRMCK
jgi:hypothetical protein